MEFKDYFVMALIMGLLIVSTIMFSVGFGVENGASSTVNDNQIVTKMFGNISNELNSSQAKSDTAKQAFDKESGNPVITTLGFVFSSIISAGQLFMNSIIGVFGYFFIFMQETFNIPTFVSGTIMAIVMGLLVLAIWSVIRSGR